LAIRRELLLQKHTFLKNELIRVYPRTSASRCSFKSVR